MKRSANLETIVDVLTYGKRNKENKTKVITRSSLPSDIGKYLLDKLVEKGLMEEGKDKIFVTTRKGSRYLHDLEELNNRYGIDSVVKTLLEIKIKYYKSRKPTTS